jgi:hypothetical protein
MMECLRVLTFHSIKSLEFSGVLLTQGEYAARVLAGFGGYAIQLNGLCVLYCFWIDDCRASRANSSFEAINIHVEGPLRILPFEAINIHDETIEANARLVISRQHFVLVYLISTRALEALEEIFYEYGSMYVYPNDDVDEVV